MKLDNSILIIGDLHAPVYHRDTVRFLTAVKAKFKPKKVVFTGDEINWESISFHTKNPDLPSPSDELEAARKSLQPFYKLFPVANILESNHGSLVMRKAISAGLPSAVIRGYQEILGAPHGWQWNFDLTLSTDLGKIYFHHGKSSSIEKLSKSMAMSAVQGHYHSRFYISYWASPIGLFWDANAGAFADHKHLAMDYAKNSIAKSIMGCIFVDRGIPQLVPMVLNKNGRWIGRL